MRKIVISNVFPSTENEKNLIEIYGDFSNSLPEKFKGLSLNDIQSLTVEEKSEYYALRRKLIGKIEPINKTVFLEELNHIEESVNLSIKNLAEKIDSMPAEQRLKYCTEEVDKVNSRLMVQKLSVNNKPEMFQDCETIFSFLKWKMLALKKPELQPDQNNSLPDWEDMVLDQKSRIRFWYYKNKYFSGVKKYKKVQLAAFACLAYDKGLIIEKGYYVGKNRQIIIDFCKSYFRADVSSVIVSGVKKDKNLNDNKTKMSIIFKDKWSFDGPI